MNKRKGVMDMRYFWLIIFFIFIITQFNYTKNYFFLLYGFIIITEAIAAYGLSDSLKKMKKEMKILNDYKIKWNNFLYHEANIVSNDNNPKRKD